MQVNAPVQLSQSSDDPKTFSGSTREVRLLQVSAEPVANLGGVGLIVLRLIKDLPSSYRVDLACPDATRDCLPNDLRDRIDKLFLTPAAKWSAAAKRDFVRRVRRRNYDLIHFHGGTFSFDAHLPWRSPLHAVSRLGIPWMYSNHCAPALTEGLFPEGYPLPWKILKSIVAFASLAWLMTVCPRQIFDSRENQERMAKHFPWVKRKLMMIYHSGIEGEPPEPEIRETVVTIGNLGHMGWRKGQMDLLEAFCLLSPKFPQLKLILAGPEDNGDCARRISAAIAKRNLQNCVSMPGGLKDLRPFWEKVDLYVQPSHYEGAPMALMEALWHGKPSVGTRVSGIPEIIEHEITGLLADPKKPAALAAAIERLIVDPELRRRFAVAGAAHILAKGMTRPQMLKRHLEVYAQLLARRTEVTTQHATT